MRRLTIALPMLTALVCSAAQPDRPERVGMASVQYVDSARQRPLNVRIWYPAIPGAVEHAASYEHAFRGSVAMDAPYRDGPPRALVLLSHGDRGTNANQSWLGEALAGHGYIVASVEHWMNTRTQNTPEATVRVWERPQDLSFVLTQLLGDPTWQARIDPARVGAAGHSSGGYTALALAGARYDPRAMRTYCASPQAGFDCGLAKGIDFEKFDFTGVLKPYRDERVRAVLALAPALGPGLTGDSLKAIAVPVLIAATEDDEILPFAQHAARVAREIPGALFERLPAGGHFVFIPECTVAGYVFTWFHRYDVCGRKQDVDRGKVHERLAANALAFFDAKLAARH
jgi:predicted dienelactone hydrolase